MLGPERTVLLEPLAETEGRPAMFLRDAFGGEVPLSCPYPPLELATAAALLRADRSPFELLCANVLRWRHRKVVQHLTENPAARVVVPSAWGSLPDDLRLMRMIRRALPTAELVLSGPNVTADPELALGEGAVDIVIRGEPEEAVALLGAGVARADVPNIAYMDGGQRMDSERRLPPGYGGWPIPARDLLDLDRYYIPFSRHSKCTTLATSRGCDHTCTFCPSQIWHQRTIRFRDTDRINEEIEELVHRYGMRELVFRDDTFTASREHTEAVCRAIRRTGKPVSWRCFATVDTVDPELLALMAGSGCAQICYGFESGDDEILAKTGKGTTTQQGHDAARWTHDAGIEVAGTFVVGLEGDTRASVERSITFAMQNRLDYVQVNAAAPLPGTGLGKRASRRGSTADPSRFRWHGGRTSDTRELSSVDVVREVRGFYRRYYFRPAYIGGRLRSGRGVRALFGHARLAWRMALYLIEPVDGGKQEA